MIRHTTFSPVARQLLVFGTYDIYEKFSEDSNSALLKVYMDAYVLWLFASPDQAS